MVIRQAFFRWLLPAAFLLPLWLVVGWGIFGDSGWSLLWVLLMAAPSVFVTQLVLTLLTRSRPSVRAERALSWWDVAGFAVWHALTIAVGFFAEGVFGWVLTGAIVAAVALLWLQLRQLWNESRVSGARLRETISWSTVTSTGSGPRDVSDPDVYIVEEKRRDD